MGNTAAASIRRRTGRLTGQELEDRKRRAVEGIDSGEYWVQPGQGEWQWVVTCWRERSTHRVNELTKECTCRDYIYRGGPCKHWYMAKWHVHRCERAWKRILERAQAALDAALLAFELAAGAAGDLEQEQAIWSKGQAIWSRGQAT